MAQHKNTRATFLGVGLGASILLAPAVGWAQGAATQGGQAPGRSVAAPNTASPPGAACRAHRQPAPCLRLAARRTAKPRAQGRLHHLGRVAVLARARPAVRAAPRPAKAAVGKLDADQDNKGAGTRRARSSPALSRPGTRAKARAPGADIANNGPDDSPALLARPRPRPRARDRATGRAARRCAQGCWSCDMDTGFGHQPQGAALHTFLRDPDFRGRGRDRAHALDSAAGFPPVDDVDEIRQAGLLLAPLPRAWGGCGWAANPKARLVCSRHCV
jgi:hypothetical protein